MKELTIMLKVKISDAQMSLTTPGTILHDIMEDLTEYYDDASDEFEIVEASAMITVASMPKR